MWCTVQTVVVLLQLLSFVVVSSGMTTTKSEEPIVIHVMAVVPTAGEQGDIKGLPRWQRGEEILPGALLAVKEISDTFNLYQLEVIPVRVPLCDFSIGIVPFVKELTSNENNIAGIVGYFCHNLAQHFSQLVQHEHIRVIQISSLDSPHLQHSILPSTEFSARAVVLLMQRLEWSRVAVISNENINFLNAKRTFLKVAEENGIKVEPILTVNLLISYGSLKQELLRFGTKIIVTFVSPSEAVDIMCTAYLNGFEWPNYAWIFMEINDSEIFMKSEFCSQNVTIIANNTLFLHPQLKNQQKQKLLPSGLNYSTFHKAYLDLLNDSETELNISLQTNLHSNVLYDSIWAFALTLNGSLNTLKARYLSLANISHARQEIMDVFEEQLSKLSFQGATGLLNFSQFGSAASELITVELFQFQNDRPIQIGSYDASIDQVLLNESLLGNFPNAALNRIYVRYPIPLTVILSLLIVLYFVLTTVSMCLFIYYRKQPAIKATSSTLSICMFIGCYLLLTSSFHTVVNGISIQGNISKSFRSLNCSAGIFLVYIGSDIVIATVIAKTLRIYHIFNKFGKVHRICSDQGLFILILTIVSVRIVLLILWTGLDVYHLVDTEQYITQSVPPYFLVTARCQSKYAEIWIIVYSSYSVALMFIMVLLAVLTRKVKRSNYKDTKKINTLVIALVFNTTFSVSLGIVFIRTDATILSSVVYSMSTLIAAFSCQVFLILPKTLPLVLPHRIEVERGHTTVKDEDKV